VKTLAGLCRSLTTAEVSLAADGTPEDHYRLFAGKAVLSEVDVEKSGELWGGVDIEF
jgi:hypothetical protein